MSRFLKVESIYLRFNKSQMEWKTTTGIERVSIIFYRRLINSIQVLVGVSRGDYANGRYTDLGGRVELGEIPEQALRREFQEEIGLSLPELPDDLLFLILKPSKYYPRPRMIVFYPVNSFDRFKLYQPSNEIISIKVIGLSELTTDNTVGSLKRSLLEINELVPYLLHE